MKEMLKEAAEDEEDPLTTDQVEYVLEYEQSREKPAARKRVIDYCKALLEELQGGGDKTATTSRLRAGAGGRSPKRGRGRPRKEEPGLPATAPSCSPVRTSWRRWLTGRLRSRSDGHDPQDCAEAGVLFGGRSRPFRGQRCPLPTTLSGR